MLETISALRRDARRLDPFTVFASRRPHEVRNQVATALCPHDMEVGVATMDASLHRVEIGGVPLMKLRYGARTSVRPQPLRGFVLLQLILSGAIEISARGQRVRCAVGDGIIMESLDDRCLDWSDDCEQLIVPVSRTSLSHAYEAMSGDVAPREFGLQQVFNLDDAEEGSGLATLIRYMVIAATGTPDGGHASPFPAMLAHHLLANHRTAEAGPLRKASAGVVPYYVKRAERLMLEQPDADLTLAALAHAAGVSIRTLTGGFRDHRGTSPLARLRDIRLDKAREHMLGADARSVTDVALRLGFNHLGRFAGQYRDRFGESPAMTLARIRDHRADN